MLFNLYNKDFCTYILRFWIHWSWSTWPYTVYPLQQRLLHIYSQILDPLKLEHMALAFFLLLSGLCLSVLGMFLKLVSIQFLYIQLLLSYGLWQKISNWFYSPVYVLLCICLKLVDNLSIIICCKTFNRNLGIF